MRAQWSDLFAKVVAAGVSKMRIPPFGASIHGFLRVLANGNPFLRSNPPRIPG